MLHNFPISDNVLHQLHASKFDFYLTGSRFFGSANETSDYDFFTPTTSVVDFLSSLGFNVVCGEYAGDPNCLCVYRYKNDKVQIDIQLVRDLQLKQKVQSLIKEHNLLLGHDKYEAKIVWTTAFYIVREMLKAQIELPFGKKEEKKEKLQFTFSEFNMMKNGERIPAIKAVRQSLNISLKEAKDLVDKKMKEMGTYDENRHY
jgi:hypothetical protein